MKRNYLYLGAVLLFMAGCTADEQTKQSDDGLVPVQLSVSLDAGSGITRTTNADLHTAATGFAENETMTVFMKNGEITTSKVYKASTVTSGVATLAPNDAADPLYYPAGTTGSVNLYAVYPATSTESHTVAYDQTSDANYKASDLMYSTQKTVNLSAKTSTQALTAFAHKMVRLKLNIVKGTGVSTITKVEMANVKRKVTVSALSESAMTLSAPATPTEETGENANVDNILIFSGTNSSTDPQTYYVVFPKQVTTGNDWNGTNFITVTADGNTANYTLTKEFTEGYQYELTLNVNAAALNATTTITDWIVGGSDVGYTDAPQTLGELTEWINYYGNLATPETDRYSGYLGWYVKADGTISQSATDAIGVIAYMSTTDVDESIPGSRILVISSTDVSTSGRLGTDAATPGLSSSTTDMNGYNNTIVLNSAYGADYAGSKCWTYNVSRPTNSSNWFLPSYAQWNSIMGTNGVGHGTNDRSKTGMDNSGSIYYWTSTEQGSGDLEGKRIGVVYPDGHLGDHYKSAGTSGADKYYVRACFAYPNKGIALSAATTNNIGWVIATNGLIYENASKTAEFGQTPVAMIAYVGAAGDVETGTSYRGLAIALSNATPDNGLWAAENDDAGLTKCNTFASAIGDMAGISNTTALTTKYSTATYAANRASSYSVSGFNPASYGCSNWFLPSCGQFVLFMNNFGANITNSSDWGQFPSSSDFTTHNSIQNALTAAGGDAAKFTNDGGYWLSTESSSETSVYFVFGNTYNSTISKDLKTYTFRVRPFLAF